MTEQILQWINDNRALLGWVGGASFLIVVLSVFIVPFLIVKMQPDYFMMNRDESRSMQGRHPVLRIIGRLLKNLVGGLLVLGGLLFLFTPGQGLLTIFIGLAVMDFPGKQKLELWFLRKKSVSWAISKLRKKANKPPLILPEH